MDKISIHAPAWGRDLVRCPFSDTAADFNPRARMGARRFLRQPKRLPIIFQSTRPHGGATSASIRPITRTRISIHAPAWGRDSSYKLETLMIRISIHAPAWGRDEGNGYK